MSQERGEVCRRRVQWQRASIHCCCSKMRRTRFRKKRSSKLPLPNRRRARSRRWDAPKSEAVLRVDYQRNEYGWNMTEQHREKLVQEHREHFQILGNEHEEASTVWLRSALLAHEQVVREEMAETIEAMQKKRNPTHGVCCTCQKCGWGYDDCECIRNDALAEAATAIRSRNQKV